MKAEHYYVRIPVALIRRRDISKTAVLLYAVLADRADRFGIVLGVYIEELAADLGGVDEKTVRRCERQLCDAGFIRITPTGRASIIELSGAEPFPASDFSAIRAYRAARRKEGSA